MLQNVYLLGMFCSPVRTTYLSYHHNFKPYNQPYRAERIIYRANTIQERGNYRYTLCTLLWNHIISLEKLSSQIFYFEKVQILIQLDIGMAFSLQNQSIKDDMYCFILSFLPYNHFHIPHTLTHTYNMFIINIQIHSVLILRFSLSVSFLSLFLCVSLFVFFSFSL